MADIEIPEREKLTIDLVKANIYALIGIIPIVILYVVPFYLVWKDQLTLTHVRSIILETEWLKSRAISFLIIISLIIIGIILHELIHGITWSFYTKNGFKSIKFGVLIKMLTPYCHCKEPLKVNQYILGAIMPAIILGVIPALLAILFGSIVLLAFGIFFTIAAMGDFLIIFLLRKENRNTLVLDHPTEPGCFIYRKKEKYL